MNDKQYAWFDGKLRSFGNYKCKECNRNWSSGNSWVDKWQSCHSCGKKIYPHDLVSFEYLCTYMLTCKNFIVMSFVSYKIPKIKGKKR